MKIPEVTFVQKAPKIQISKQMLYSLSTRMNKAPNDKRKIYLDDEKCCNGTIAWAIYKRRRRYLRQFKTNILLVQEKQRERHRQIEKEDVEDQNNNNKVDN